MQTQSTSENRKLFTVGFLFVHSPSSAEVVNFSSIWSAAMWVCVRRYPMVAWMVSAQICERYGSISLELNRMWIQRMRQNNTAALDQRINLHLMFDSSRLSQTRWECEHRTPSSSSSAQSTTTSSSMTIPNIIIITIINTMDFQWCGLNLSRCCFRLFSLSLPLFQ